MKKIVTEERYEEHGSPMFWIYLFLGAMWVLMLVLHISDGDSGIEVARSAFCTVASFLTAGVWSGYHLVVDEKGIEVKETGRVRTIAWNEIERVTVHNKVSFWKSTGLTFHMLDPRAKPYYINKQDELLPLVKRYTDLPIEEAA